jgi:hypothetical protein
VDQGELMDWARTPGISKLVDRVWSDNLAPLSDERFRPNLELNDPLRINFPFSNDDDSMTAIVCLPLEDRILTPFEQPTPQTMRHSYLPDAASGKFAPGWDISIDFSRGVFHLASYGLGSPFPEDSKLCAALSTFWPAVAPDASSSFWGNPVPSPTVSPLTDEETGQSGNIPWDGAAGPKIINIQQTPQIEYLDFDYVDYVNNMVQNKFTLKLTWQVDITKYKSRILALAIAYKTIPNALGIPPMIVKTKWPVISFKEISATDPEFIQAQIQADPTGRTLLKEDLYRVELCNIGNSHPNPGGDFKKVTVDIKKRITFFVGSGSLNMVLCKNQDGDWRLIQTP